MRVRSKQRERDGEIERGQGSTDFGVGSGVDGCGVREGGMGYRMRAVTSHLTSVSHLLKK